MTDTPQENSFIDLLEDDSWTASFLVQSGPTHSFVLSTSVPGNGFVPNDRIAPFRSQNRGNVLQNAALLEVFRDIGTGLLQQQLHVCVAESMSEEPFVQIFAGILPLEIALDLPSLSVDLTYYWLCRYYELLPTVSQSSVARTWASYWACEQHFLTHYEVNVTYLLSMHIHTLASSACPPCVSISFPMLRLWTGIDAGYTLDLTVWSAASETYLTYCIRAVKIEEAISTLALVLRCYAATGRSSITHLEEMMLQMSWFFQDFPQLAKEKAEILNYLLLVSDINMTIEDVSANQLLDNESYQHLMLKFPLALAKLVKLSVCKPIIPHQISSNLSTFPLFSSTELETLLEKLPEKEEFELCWVMKSKRVVTELQHRRTVRRIRRIQKLALIWTVAKTGMMRLPRGIVRKIIARI